MDDTFIRAVAALQAHLVTLEEEADAFTELSDMQAVRQFKTRLEDYIEAHAAKGALPPDPYGVIAERLKKVEQFFGEAKKESDFLLGWKRDWLEYAPIVGLADLQKAGTRLEELAQKLPEIQARLAVMIHPLDWDETKADLQPEVQICASALKHLSLPDSSAMRRDFFQFAHGKGNLSKRVSKRLSDLHKRIAELARLHARSAEKIRVVEQHLANHNFRRASGILAEIKQNFTDIPYITANKALENLIAKHTEFKELSKSLEGKLKSGGWKNLHSEFARLQRGIVKPESELGRECHALLDRMESRLSSFLAARKSKRIKGIAVAAVLALLATGVVLLARDSIAKAEQTRVEAAAKLEREQAEAAVKLEREQEEVARLERERAAKAEREQAEAAVKLEREQAEVARLERERAAKAERERAEAAAKLELERAEAAAKAERERAKARSSIESAIQSGAIGNSLNIPLPGESLLRMAYCPAGSFTMGSPASEEGRSSAEDQLQVRISKAFWLGKTELTQAQWRAVMGKNPSSFEGDNLPVESVSWEDAQEFIAKVNASGILPPGWKLALPTEAQWEYACRAGTSGPYAGPSLDALGWYDDNSGGKTHPAAKKAPNAWGLHDMHGNVWEWCADWYDSTLAGGIDSKGPTSGVYRVYRGGSWREPAANCGGGIRGRNEPGYRSSDLGFRPAMVPSE